MLLTNRPAPRGVGCFRCDQRSLVFWHRFERPVNSQGFYRSAAARLEACCGSTGRATLTLNFRGGAARQSPNRCVLFDNSSSIQQSLAFYTEFLPSVNVDQKFWFRRMRADPGPAVARCACAGGSFAREAECSTGSWRVEAPSCTPTARAQPSWHRRRSP